MPTRSKLQVRDLMDLAAMEGDDAAGVLSTVYGWLYDHLIARAKALAAAGSAVALTTILPIISPSKSEPPSQIAIVVTLLAAAVLLVVGLVMYFRARQVHIEFIAAQSLLSELIELRPFLRRLREGA